MDEAQSTHDLAYVRGVAPGTRLPDRKAGIAPTEDQMLLEMEMRLRVVAQTNDVTLTDDSWWSSKRVEKMPARDAKSPHDESGCRMRVRVPASALERRGPEKTAEYLGMVTEVAMHARVMNDGPPADRRTGDPADDAAIAGYIAGAARDMATQFGLTGTFEPSQKHLPPEEREVLFLDLEYFDEMIAEKHGKRFGETEAYEEAQAAEARHFDPSTSAVAREAVRAIGLQYEAELQSPNRHGQHEGVETPDSPTAETPTPRPPRPGGYNDAPTPPARPPGGTTMDSRETRTIEPGR